MKVLYTVLGVLLFALVTAVLYVWGLRKSMGQQQDMSRRLRSKCAGIVVRQLRTRGELTEAEIADRIAGVKTGVFWSRQKAVVGRPQEFAAALLGEMLDQRLIERTETGYRLK